MAMVAVSPSRRGQVLLWAAEQARAGGRGFRAGASAGSGAQDRGGAVQEPLGERVQRGRAGPGSGVRVGAGVVPGAGRLGGQRGPRQRGGEHLDDGVALVLVGVAVDAHPQRVLADVVYAGQVVGLAGGAEALIDDHVVVVPGSWRVRVPGGASVAAWWASAEPCAAARRASQAWASAARVAAMCSMPRARSAGSRRRSIAVRVPSSPARSCPQAACRASTTSARAAASGTAAGWAGPRQVRRYATLVPSAARTAS